ncbi:MAG TPA: hypothetical protein VF175_08820 [Lacipirellula sp.]
MATGRSALAAPPNVVGYELFMSPYAHVLDALEEFGEASPEFYDVWSDAMWDNPHIRVRARNKPAFMVINKDTTQDAVLSSFSVTINEGPYFFGTGDFITDNFMGFIQNTVHTDPGVTITGSSLSPDGQTLTVNFDGLTAGKKAIFNVDLDTSDMSLFPYPDYRVVLCGDKAGQFDTPNMTGTIAATFTSTTMGPPNNTTTLDMDLPPSNDTLAIYEQVVRAAKDMEMVDYKGKEMMIPEPSGALLAFLGATLALAGRRRSTLK